MFSTYKVESAMISNGNIYLLQYASFINKDIMNENIKKLENYIIYEHDDKYYVHLGAYYSLDTARKMQKYFENKDIYTYIKNDYITDETIINKIKEIDKDILNEEDNNKIIELNKKILNILKNDVS